MRKELKMDLKALQEMPPWEWPGDTDEQLLKILRDPGAGDADRIIAAELAGGFTVVNDPVADELLAIVRNAAESDDIRARAAISLGPALEQAWTAEFDDPDEVPISEPMFHKIQAVLREVYSDKTVPKPVRRRVLEAAVRAPEDWQADAIRQAFLSDDRDWQITALFGMQHVRGFDKQILTALASPDSDIQFEAVRAAGEREVDAAWPHLLRFLADRRTDKPTLLAIFDAVSKIRSGEAFAVLDPFTHNHDREIAEAAEEAIGAAQAYSAGEGMEDEEEWDEEEDEDKDGWVN